VTKALLFFFLQCGPSLFFYSQWVGSTRRRTFPLSQNPPPALPPPLPAAYLLTCPPRCKSFFLSGSILHRRDSFPPFFFLMGGAAVQVSLFFFCGEGICRPFFFETLPSRLLPSCQAIFSFCVQTFPFGGTFLVRGLFRGPRKEAVPLFFLSCSRTHAFSPPSVIAPFFLVLEGFFHPFDKPGWKAIAPSLSHFG